MNLIGCHLSDYTLGCIQLDNMGCAGSSQTKAEGTAKKIRKPKAWKHPQPITKSQLIQLREEFWDTAPHYGGTKEIWDALRAAAEADLTLAQAIVDSAGIIVQNPDLTVCFDERGNLNWAISL
ncbi:UNVERIFIED_CONTAM: Ubiquitin domain-containing protein 2 [Sesamum radiatum]|uniref:Ubiquitin domain-containing protein 2 n=1 Tax=Sesamum radiatum TaxID=300843 RepID=A0AAW2T3Z8_SESRA